MHCLNHRSVFHMETNVLWAKSYLPPLPPCNVVRKERLADESSNIASEYWSNSGKRHFVPHILARIVVGTTPVEKELLQVFAGGLDITCLIILSMLTGKL